MHPEIYKFKDEYPKDFNDEDYIEFLDLPEDNELRELTSIFLTVPWQYSDNFLSGKKQSDLAQFLELYDFNVKETLPLLLQMTNMWVNIKHKTSKIN